jgi:hypothetical protein
MAAINNGLIPVAKIRELMNGFNVGGFAESLMPKTHFADGGLVTAAVSASGSGGTFSIVLDGKAFGGFSGPADQMRGLEKTAARMNLRSAGRKPAWFR